MTRRLNVLYKCLIVSNGAQNRNRYNQVPSFVEIPPEFIKLNSAHKIALLMIKGNNSKYMQSRVMVLAYDILSHCALEV